MTTLPPPPSCAVRSVVRQWSDGFVAHLVVENTGTTAIDGWTMTWRFWASQQVQGIWGAKVVDRLNNSYLRVRDTGRNAVIPPGGTVSLGARRHRHATAGGDHAERRPLHGGRRITLDSGVWRRPRHLATLTPVYDYDLLVLGSGPSGQKAAIAAAKLGRRVGIVDRRDMIGGVCINTGTVPSKTLREAVLYLTGLSQRDLYGSSYRVKEEITVSDLAARTQHVITSRPTSSAINWPATGSR